MAFRETRAGSIAGALSSLWSLSSAWQTLRERNVATTWRFRRLSFSIARMLIFLPSCRLSLSLSLFLSMSLSFSISFSFVLVHGHGSMQLRYARTSPTRVHHAPTHAGVARVRRASLRSARIESVIVLHFVSLRVYSPSSTLTHKCINIYWIFFLLLAQHFWSNFNYF